MDHGGKPRRLTNAEVANQQPTAGESATEGADDDEPALVVNRWRRYGKDRLYVGHSDQTKVGWWDLATDEPHPETPEQLADLCHAVRRWKQDQTAPQAPTSAAATPETTASETGGTGAEQTSAGATTAGATTTEAAGTGAASAAGASGAGPGITQVGSAPSGERSEAEPTQSNVSVGGAGDAPPRPWLDLATNDAGAAAREQAIAAKDAAPVRTMFARALGVHTPERAWRIGAQGEEKVAAQLAKVWKKDSRWRVIHAIPVGTRGSDIDHLIIGPGGVFTANAKHHPGAKIWVGGNTFLVNGVKQPYIRNSRHEATRAAGLLTEACGFPVHVEGLIVTVNAADVVVKSQPEGTSVVPRMQIARWLLRHGDILDAATVETIYEVARRSTTWRT